MDRIRTAALNNALWCDALCRAHERPGIFRPGLWLNPAGVPPFYPNMITISPHEIAEQTAALRDLLRSRLPAGWGVKDSFCRLDLEPLGFRILFEAEWFYRAPAPLSPDARQGPPPMWERILDEAELAEWEQAWSGGRAPDPSRPRQFPSTLLDDREIAILALRQGNRGAILAGAVVGRGAGAIGLTNVFTPAHRKQDLWATLLSKVYEVFGEAAIVGYEPPGFVKTMPDLGLEALGALRIWAAPASTGPTPS